MEHRGLPHSFRLTPAEDSLLKQLVQIHGTKSESEYMRRLLLAQGELYNCDYVPKIDGQSAFAFVPRLASWAPLERLVRAHVNAERGAGGEPPTWTAPLDKPADENEAIDVPQVCCSKPLPVVVGTLFGCARCEQTLPIAGALALLRWRAKRVERTNKPLHDELMRQVEAMEQIEKLEREHPSIRKARTNLSALYYVPSIVETKQDDDDNIEDEWPFVDKYSALWDVLCLLDRLPNLTIKQIAALTEKHELNVESAIDMGVDDGWMTHVNDNVAITARGRKFIQCTTERGGTYRRWEEMDCVWPRILQLLAPGKAITLEAIADQLSEHEDIVYGVLQLSETWQWVESDSGLIWQLAEWLQPLHPLTKEVLGQNWCERQKDFYLPGGTKTNVAAVKESLLKLQTNCEEVAGPVPSTPSTPVEVQDEEVAGPVPSTPSTPVEVQDEEVAGPVPSTLSTTVEVQVEEVAGPVPSTLSPFAPPRKNKRVKTAAKTQRVKANLASSPRESVVLRARMKGARKALIHIVAKCNPVTTTQWHSVCGVALEPMGMPPKNGVLCSACKMLLDEREPLLEQDLPRVEGWVRLWDEKHDLAHTKRKAPFWGSDNVAVCNVVLTDETKNGASSKWKLAPEHVRDCPKCASLRDKRNTAGAQKAVTA
jgi:hypothetical protein